MARQREYREVINNSDEEYKEMFGGKDLTFPPRGGIVMERRDAVRLLGQYVPFDREKSSGEKPLSWRPANGKRPTAPLPDVEIDEPQFVNIANGKVHPSQEALDEDLKGFSHLTIKEKED
jgi:hypothetical protein